MVRAVVLLALTACGRFEFDTLRADDAGVVVADSAPACDSCTLADSEAEFSATQGANGWYYGYWHAAVDGDGVYNAATDFIEMVDKSGLWRPADFDPDPMSASFTWCYIARWGGHPGAFPTLKYPIRRWTSDAVGTASITVRIMKADTDCGDGTRGVLFVDGVERWSYAIDAMDNVGTTQEVPVDLRTGTTIDFLLEPRADDGCDTTTHGMIIHGP